MPHIEPRQIEAFLAVADERHFGRAGERLQLSTSQVSQLVSALERRIGGRLFERTSRRVEITALGLALRNRVAPAYSDLVAALEQTSTDARRAHGVLRVGVPNSFDPDLIGSVVDRFSARFGVEIQQQAYPIWDATRPGQADRWDVFVLLSLHQEGWIPGLTRGPAIRRVERRLLLSRSHPLASRSVVDIEELPGHRIVRPAASASPLQRAGVTELLDDWYPDSTPAGRPLSYDFVMQAGLVDELLPVLTDGDAVHLTFDVFDHSLLPEPLTLVPLTGLPLAEVCAVWPNGPNAVLAEAFATVASGGE